MGYLDGSLSAPSTQVCDGNDLVPNLAYKMWHTQDRILLSLLYASLTEECMAKVVNCTTARDAWLALEVSFSYSSNTRELQLKDELQLMQRGSRGVVEYVRSFQSLCDQLSAIGKPVDDTDKLPIPYFANLVPKALSHELFSRLIPGDSSSQSAMVVQHGVPLASSSASTPCVPCADSSPILMPPITLSQPSSPELALDVPPPTSSSAIQLSTSTHPMITRARDGIVKPPIIHSLCAFTTPPWFQMLHNFVF
ncbi:hypothetical protein Patl1_12192 [Pistacia atlantica]|uniref:Uncharacterized protein n=1 Tax=Pistacia atlantica TaxID=434234 RepID=A0ACC1A5D7_9ROSI|nr:hypothetical protein Patl1_12192 [Pistacia atlantica]